MLILLVLGRMLSMKSFFRSLYFPSFRELEPGELPFSQIYQLCLTQSSLKKAMFNHLPIFIAIAESSCFFHPFRFIPSLASLFSKKSSPYFLTEGEEERAKAPFCQVMSGSTVFEGVLVERADGALYLKVGSFLFKQLSCCSSLAKKESFILVMTAQERKNLAIDSKQELGKKMSFSLKGFFEVDLPFKKRTLEFIKIFSEELQELRQKYLLPSLLQGRDFFLPIKERHLEKSLPSSLKINPALLSA